MTQDTKPIPVKTTPDSAVWPRQFSIIQSLLTLLMALGLFVFGIDDLVQERTMSYWVLFAMHALDLECIYNAPCAVDDVTPHMVLPGGFAFAYLFMALLLVMRNFRRRTTLWLGIGLSAPVIIMCIAMLFHGTLFLAPVAPKLIYLACACVLISISIRKYKRLMQSSG